jgi:hypothetical protein
MTHRHQLLAQCSKRGLNVYDLALTADISHGAFRVWHLILKFRDKNTGVAWSCPGVKTLCTILNCTPESFGQWRRELEDALLLRVENIGGPTRRRWQYTILDGTGENSSRASLYSVRVNSPMVGKSRPSKGSKPENFTVGKSPPRQSANADREGGQKPTPSNPLIREDGGASPARPDVRASERRQETMATNSPSSDEKEKSQATGANLFEAMRRAADPG